MKYTKNAFDKAEQTLFERRKKSNDEHDKRLSEIESNAPEIANMYRELSGFGFEMVKLIGSGDKNVRPRIKELKDKNLAKRQAISHMLSEFGYPEDYLQYHYYCSNCCDRGYSNGVRCKCMTELLEKFTAQEINKNCMIKLHDFSEFKLEYYPEKGEAVSPRNKMSKIFNDCRNYADNFSEHSPSLFFFGGTGLGKTFLSSCIAKQLLSQGRNVVFGSILDIFRKIENEHFKGEEGNTAEIVKNAELVILDDLGSEFKTNFTNSVLYEIINYRLNLELPVIISTNLSMQELNQQYNERIVSRLTGYFMPFKFMGNDVRPAVRQALLVKASQDKN